ncbi:MAG: Gfo/Idh/MocA family protein [Mycobacteriales bacterium]
MRWGILGPGRIARSFLTGLAGSATQSAVAVGSRDLGRARAVADDFGVPRAYGSYEELIADDGVEAVYVALPNSLHAPWSDAAARAGRQVLCEKPLGRSAAEVEAMVRVGRECGVRLMEAFMYRFHPRTLALAGMVARGDLGEPRLLRASFGFTVTDIANVRLSAELAGGALMDVGCYPVNATRMLAGRVTGVTASARWADSGVDETLAGTLEHASGALSAVSCSLASSHHNLIQLVGTDGVVDVPSAFTPAPDRPSVLVHTPGARGGQPREIRFEPVNQYTLEAEGFAAAVAAGDDGAAGLPQLPLTESLDNAATIDALLRSSRQSRPVAV